MFMTHHQTYPTLIYPILLIIYTFVDQIIRQQIQQFSDALV